MRFWQSRKQGEANTMHVYRFYVPIKPQIGVVSLSGDVAHRICNVLRKRVGDEVVLTDGCGHEMRARIVEMQRGKVTVAVEEVTQPSRESEMLVCIAASILKGERFELLIQKAVEVGVREILPLLSCRTVARISDAEKKRSRWLSIAISAMEQSGGCVLPRIYEPMKLEEALQALSSFDVKLILHERASKMMRELVNELRGIKSAAIFVGPEGGFDDSEVELALACGAIPVCLSKRILRAETAAIVGASILVHCL